MNDPLIKNRRKRYVPVLIFGIIFSITLVFYTALDVVYADRIMPGIKFGSEVLGGMDWPTAGSVISDLLDEQTEQELIFINNDTSIIYSLSDLGISFDHYASSEAAKQFARGHNPFTNLFQRIRGLLGGVSIRARYHKSDVWDQVLLELESQINVEPLSAQVMIEPDKFKAEAVSAVVGHKLDRELFDKIVKSRLGELKFDSINLPIASYSPILDTKLAQITAQKINQQLDSNYLLKFKDQSFELTVHDLWDWLEVVEDKNMFIVRLREAEVTNYVKDLEQSINQPMQNAIFQIKDDRVTKFLPHQLGALLRTKETIELIQAALLDSIKEIELPANYLEPKITLEQIQKLIDDWAASSTSG